ncbi:hypothetical protein LCL95_01830 [Bacillus timonensis]|nr:hypothetical protein [Bacillus timonensis]
MLKRFLCSFFILITLNGCASSGGMEGEKPPENFVQIGNEKYETILGTYCWKNKNKGICVDTAGPVELLEGKSPIQVKPGQEITFVMNFEPQPNKIHLIQMNGDVETELTVKANRFTAPTQKGIYFYSYGVWWMDDKESNVSNGDAFYAFALEVQ